MCGRIVLKAPSRQVAEEFELPNEPVLEERFNIAPTEPVAAVRIGVDGSRSCDTLQWGLIPPWSTDPRVGAKMFNARSETVTDKPSFREAFAQRRCLVPVSGFYEWKKQDTARLPYYFSHADQRVLALAGLWERWEFPGGKVLESCSVLTTAANQFMRRFHHRMPVILSPADYGRWLETGADEAEGLQDLLVPAAEDVLRSWPVADLVNKSSNDGPQLIEPVHETPPGQLPLF